MTSHPLRRTLGRFAGAGLIAAVVIGMAAPPAFADTSTAAANAATLVLAGNPLITTNTCIANNPGGLSGTCGNLTGGLLPTTVLAVGVLAQQASATGTAPALSAACAGLIGAGAQIQIGPSGSCGFAPSNPSGGVTVNLGAVATLHADAIVAECSDSSTGSPVASVQLVNATVTLLTAPLTPIPLTSPIAPNTPVASLGALLNITLNAQAPGQKPGTITTTALVANVLGILPRQPPLVTLTIGTVVCGPNAATPATPAFPLKGAPIALGILLAAGFIGWRFWWVPRQRAGATPA